MSLKLKLFGCLLVASFVTIPPAYTQQTAQTEREAMYYRYENLPSYIKGGSVEPHWMADGSSFWYVEDDPDNTIIYKVVPEANTKEPLFDAKRLRKALTPLLGHEPPGKGLPFRQFTWADDEKAVRFEVENKPYLLQLDTYAITPAQPTSEAQENRMIPQSLPLRFTARGGSGSEILSPDGRWFVTLKDHNLWLRSTSDDSSVQLTTDGVEGFAWELPEGGLGIPWAHWSPDSSQLAVLKTDRREVTKMPLIDWLEPTAEVRWIPHARAGEPLPRGELYIVDIRSKQKVYVDTDSEQYQKLCLCGWHPGGSELFLIQWNRTNQKVQLLAANPATGATRVVLTEIHKTYWSAFADTNGTFFTLLKNGNRFLWMSEQDGWRHIYLYDLKGTLIRRLTEGNFPVVKLVAVDERLGWIYFTAHGDRRRPYDTHLYRVNLQGEGFIRLTEAPGQHVIEFSPSKQLFLDTHSTIARPTVVDLKRTDGKLLQTLSKANIDALKELKWKPTEEFVVKAADGKTDLWGILYKPYDFDPEKKYPVIEFIYGSPHTTHAIGTFGRRTSSQSLPQLGFIVFRVDGRGTPERGKAFQDVGHRQMNCVIPDHLAVLKQLAAQRPYMDMSRVGIYGVSNGGYHTIRAMLLAPDVYRVGVAASSVIDWQDMAMGEWWQGLPQDNINAPEYCSNVPLAGNLKGKLLIIHGTDDQTAVFSGIMKMVYALAQAGKRYDLIILPGAGHGLDRGKQYDREARRRYFQEHLKPVPTVEIIRPLESNFEPGETVAIKARASASADARVLRVEFLVDGRQIGVDPEPPYEFNWLEAKKGRHVFMVRVYDNSGRMEPSPPVVINIGK